ncbi:4Fe-4S dicluster domain-containing protein [Myxococcota bacterium]|nr:4Fe-4S dicluster domain-containing protein [Myxococcota bacterium]MBU1534652.1 4Fe-4S dicluster domain-containing protein [Myxococcota bacterium]
MAHLTVKSGYRDLEKRINRFPQGAPPSELLFKILSLLFSENEARLVSRMPIRPFTLQKIAGIWRMSEEEAERICNDLADRGMLVDLVDEHTQTYVLPPPMAGFIEFSLMRVRKDVDQKALSELYYRYLNVEEDFVRELFTVGETQIGRVFVEESALVRDNTLQVLDYERASHVINDASHIGIGVCYCRHKMEHVGKNCDAPMDICMTFNTSAASLIKHGIARSVDAAECLDLLALAREKNLVQFGENVQQRVNFICNCCGCCCEALLAAQRFGFMNPVATTGFLPVVNTDLCNGCGKCVDVCPVEALSLVSANDPHKPKKRRAKVDERICLGCAVCIKNCTPNALTLKPREQKIITPVDSTHKVVLMAMERGKLQNLIFDEGSKSHRALAAILGVLLKLPPMKRLMALKQVRSRYILSLLAMTSQT